jgi:hypothetical protein
MLAMKVPMLSGKEPNGAPGLQECEVVELCLGAGTIGLLLGGVHHEVEVVHVVTQLVVSRHVHGASGVITSGEMPKALPLDLRCVVHTSGKASPIYRLLMIQLDYSFIHFFGCAYWPSLCKYNMHKLAFRSMISILGYSLMHKGYTCLDHSIGWILFSHDVIFDESIFSYTTSGVTVDVSILEEVISFPSTELATSAPVRNYDLTYLSTDAPACVFHVNGACFYVGYVSCD